MRRRRSTSAVSGTLMLSNGRIAMLPSAACGICSAIKLKAPAAAEVARTSRRVVDVADMTFSFVAHIRCNWMRCNDARDRTANPLYDGVIDYTMVSSTLWYRSARLLDGSARREGQKSSKINLRSGLNAAGIATWPAPRKLKAASPARSCLLVCRCYEADEGSA